MTNNKNKNKNNAAAKSTTVDNKKTQAAAPEVKNNNKPKAAPEQQKGNKVPEKQPDKKHEVDKNAGEQSGTVTITTVEEVKEPQIQQPFAGKTTQQIIDEFDLGSGLDANHRAVLLSTLERRTSRMKPNESKTIYMESMLDYNLAWECIKLSIQTAKEKKSLNILMPADEAALEDFLSTFKSLGVALEPHKREDGQLALEFKEIDKETKAEAEAEIAAEQEANQQTGSTQASASAAFKHKEWTDADLDPNNWMNNEEAKAALKHIMNSPNQSPSNKFLQALGKTRIYLQKMETDPVKKSSWDTISLGGLMREFINLMDSNKISALINGMGGAAVNSMKCGQTMIFAHSLFKKNMPALKDAEIADLIKEFINLLHIGDKPIEEDLAVVNGILKPDRDTFVRIAKQSPDETKEETSDVFKKILNPLRQAYLEEIGTPNKENEKGEIVANPDFFIKATNKMIEIRNLYVDKDAAFELFTAETFPKE